MVNQNPRFQENVEKETVAISNEEIKSVQNIVEQPVKGKVFDERGKPLFGVNVLIKGTQKGTRTDANGNFKIDANKNSTLLFSFVGYVSKEVQVTEEENITVKLESSIGELTEIVVVGSRSNMARTKTETPAPVDVISVKELAQTGQTDLTQMINFLPLLLTLPVKQFLTEPITLTPPPCVDLDPTKFWF